MLDALETAIATDLPAPPPTRIAPSNWTPEQCEKVANLLDLLDTSDMASIEYMRENSTDFSSLLGNEFDIANAQISGFDFELAYTTIKKLQQEQ